MESNGVYWISTIDFGGQKLLKIMIRFLQNRAGRPLTLPRTLRRRTKSTQEAPKRPQKAPKSPKSATRAAQERPKSAPRRPKSAPDRPKPFPNRAQDTPKSDFLEHFLPFIFRSKICIDFSGSFKDFEVRESLKT